MLKYTEKVLAIISGILLVVMLYLSIELIASGKESRNYKSDYAILHSSAYGMFNSDIWTKKITSIIDNKIQEFDFNENNREDIKSYISTIIDTLILEADRIVRERNEGQRGFFDSLMGTTKQMITDSIFDIRKLRNRVPEFTDAVMSEVEKPKNQKRAKLVLREKLKEFTAQRFPTTTDMTGLNTILLKYKTKSVEECNKVLDTHRTILSESMNTRMEIILFLALVIIILVVSQGILSSLRLFLLSSTSVILLVSGVMLPMLDIEAKISKLYFVILDQSVVFENQILFFQSKSISDLVTLLLDSGEAKMILVGILLVMFSIIFPSIKLLASYLYFYSKGFMGNNSVTSFFALRSTKWSMADVMVVSIFMAYLGLDGVISTELKHLESLSEPVNIITSNQTHLEVGFFLFLGFVATSFVLSWMVESKQKKI